MARTPFARGNPAIHFQNKPISPGPHVSIRNKQAVAPDRLAQGDNDSMSASPSPDKPPSVDVPREFHRRMAAIIDAVQVGIWEAGVHDLLGYATDYAFGQERGLQTLVLK